MRHPWRREAGRCRAQRILRVWRAQAWRYAGEYDDDGPVARRLLRTRAPCSCPMCGNPRRHWGEHTVQERRAG